MNSVMADESTGKQYMLNPSPQDLETGIIPCVPELHAHLWTYVTLNGVVYTNQFELEDWDADIILWNELGMGQWPFGNSLPDDVRVMLEADYCLKDLDSYLDNELYVMEIEQELLNEQDDDEEEEEEEEESDDEGYITDDEVEDEEPVNFGIAAWLFHIQI